jgi:predicted transcriptional regulator
MEKMKPKLMQSTIVDQRAITKAAKVRGPELRLLVENERDFFRRVREAASKPQAQAAAKPTITLSFQSATDLLTVLTPKRHALFDVVRTAGAFDSIEDLAQAVARDRAAVSRDLKALAEAGLVSVQDVAFPGHGRRTRIVPAASRIKLELTL